MANIEVQPDCGNSPRKKFLAAFLLALASGDERFIMENVPDSIRWEIVGRKHIDGKSGYITELYQSPFWNVTRLTLHTIITHGADASANGEIITKK